MTVAAPSAPARARIRVEGTVQGVGFRPHVYRLARESGLDGFVLNDARGVLIEVDSVIAGKADFEQCVQRERFYRRLGCVKVQGVSYILPLPGAPPTSTTTCC